MPWEETVQPYRYTPGAAPLLISVPHCGALVPEHIEARFTDEARALPDTDWHVDRLYAFARDLGAHLLTAIWSRSVVDLNREPGGEALYPGHFNTPVCPEQLFSGRPLYQEGQGLHPGEVAQRVTAYWQPYHEKLGETLAALRAQHGVALLLDAHSIRSSVPALFEGTLPALNLGTADGRSADPALAACLLGLCQASGYSSVLNGRFKGGYITRHYGAPAYGIHAVQMELTQRCYMEEHLPFTYHEDIAAQLQEKALRPCLEAMLAWARGEAAPKIQGI